MWPGGSSSEPSRSARAEKPKSTSWGRMAAGNGAVASSAFFCFWSVARECAFGVVGPM
jgi:hypothetical protein